MTDLQTLGIDIEVTGTEDARSKLAAANQTMRHLNVTVDELASRVGLLRDSQERWRDANGRFVSSVSATKSVLQQLRLETLSRAFSDIEKRLDPVSAKMSRLSSDLKILDAAFVSGAVDLDRYEASSSLLSAEMDKLAASASKTQAPITSMQARIASLVGITDEASASTQRITARTSMFARALSDTSGHALGYGTRMGAASQHTTNLMFQLQDIGMMMAMGQNPLLTMAQQGTQVSGVFHQMRRDGMTLSTGLREAFGAMLNSVTAWTFAAIGAATGAVWLARRLWEAREGSISFSEALDITVESLSRLSSAQSGSIDGFSDLINMGGVYGDTAQRILELHRDLANISTRDAISDLVGAVSDDTGLGRIVSAVEAGRRQMDELLGQPLSVPGVPDTGLGLREALGRNMEQQLEALQQYLEDVAESGNTTVEAILDYSAALASLESAEGPTAQAEAARELTRAYLATRDAALEGSDINQEFVQGLMQIEMGALRTILAEERRSAAYESTLIQLQRQIAENRLIAQFGEEHASVSEQRAQTERDIFEEQQRSSGVIGTSLVNVMALYDTNVSLLGVIRQQRAEQDLSTMLSDMQQQLALQAAVAQYGADSVQAARLRADAEEKVLQAQVDNMVAAAGNTQEARALADQVMEVWRQTQNLATASGQVSFDHAANSAARLADNLRRAVNEAINLGAQSVHGVEQARISHEFRNDPVGRATALAAAEFDSRTGDISAADSTIRNVVEAERREYIAAAAEAERYRQSTIAAQRAEARRNGQGSSGSRGSSDGGGQSELAREAEERASAIRSVVDALNLEIEALGQSDLALKINQQLRSAGVDIMSEEGQAIAELTENLHNMEAIRDASSGFADNMARAVTNAENAKDILVNIGESILQSLSRISAQMISTGTESLLLSFLGSSFGGLENVPSSLTSALDSFEGGGRTRTGPRTGGLDGKGGYLAVVHPNEEYIDLEGMSAEMRTPTAQSSRSEVSTGTSVVVNLDARGADSSTLPAIRRAVEELRREIPAIIVEQRRRPDVSRRRL